MIKALLFGCNSFDTNANTNVLSATTEYILSTKRFEEEPEIFKQGYESVSSVFIGVVTCIVCRFLFLFSSDLFYSWLPLQLQVPGDCLF